MGWYVLLCAFLFGGALVGSIILIPVLALGVPDPYFLLEAMFLMLPGWTAWIVFARWRRQRAVRVTE